MFTGKKKAACAAMLSMAMVAPLAAFAENETRVITCGTLNLRAEESASSKILGKYGWGSEVLVKGINGDWASVDVGDLLARLLHRCVAGVGKAVCTGRVGILLRQIRHHGLKCLAAEPRCRGVIHIDHEKFSPIYIVVHSMRRFGVTGMRPCAPPKRFRPPG